ncbi:helix-turn-helix domain-containing protein [Candidatus Palauibacter sp.]|uniref:helix-turn-helix domain-containing protein n=1 Tax=Candidatus Palauibacter sp. TaxID=3101350 RepID=UPI003AF27601
MANEAWVERQTATPEARRLYEEERLILWTTEAIAEAMARRGLTRAGVAAILGTSRPNVTQLLSGSRNMTLRTLAALAHACGTRAVIEFEPVVASTFKQLGDHTIWSHRTVHVTSAVDPQLALETSVSQHGPQHNRASVQEDSRLNLVA